MQTIKQTLSQASERLAIITETPLLEAEILLAFLLQKERSYLKAWDDKTLENTMIESFNDLIESRLCGKPLAYLTGTKEFWSRDFKVNAEVLIPRPETELLIELSLNYLSKDKGYRIADLGTGSGIIAITLACEYSNAQVVAVDKSEQSLEIARFNAQTQGINTIEFIQSDWFSNIPSQLFDLIVTNPPYVAEYEYHVDLLRYEPRHALVSGEEGLSDIKIIIENAKNYLENNGYLLIEHGYNQAQQVHSLFQVFGYSHIETHHDLAGHPRVTLGQLIK